MDLGFNPDQILRLPTQKKVAIIAGIILVLTGVYWYFLLQDTLDAIQSVNDKISKQQEKIDSKKKMLASLPKLRKELEELKVLEAKAAQNLPSKQEIPALLTDISEAGHEQGLEFILFAPKPELAVKIYAEVPVEVSVRGSFHATVTFMDKVTRMSRIATFSNLSMTPESKSDTVTTTARLTTYRFLDAKDAGFKSPSEKKKKK
ncbi:MAG: pilO [Magnetococcales bacterium]|nr:pilO [Magnetococcales bacterium]HIJ83404.1 type 4a pilus biogenesis protein PilO [Magnetococcales bacterium]